MEWAQDHRNWTLEDWSHVVWSDESKFVLFRTDGIVFVQLSVAKYRAKYQLPTLSTAEEVSWSGLRRENEGVSYFWRKYSFQHQSYFPTRLENQKVDVHARNELQDEWSKIDQAYIRKLLESVASRSQAVIDAKGYATKYEVMRYVILNDRD
ncbi:unnamed protein product [Nippostrongylus brasiliensis]|uniref:Transposable element Tc3 transposase n=1 Tax=Nippostrongylus brasiliensis TaxID=27835 RepID=A0A0N4Y2P1_NIPBR|nr:unnamed protein product [Nippostrongylus brasiliensis]